MGSGPELKTGYSGEQQLAMGAYYPAMQRAGMLSSKGLGLYDIPKAPQAPSYNVVNPEIMMPTQQWWDSLSPNVMQGLWSPYQQAGQALTEQMSSYGQVGSGRGGYSGSAATAMGKLAAEAGKGVGLQAWQMTQPAMQTYWNTLQQREMYQPLANYEMAQQAWQADIASRQAAQQAALGGFQNIANQGAAAWTPTSTQMLLGGILGGVGGAMQGYQSGGGWMGALGGGLSGFGQGYYGG